MNVASLELCRELYELSSWRGAGLQHGYIVFDKGTPQETRGNELGVYIAGDRELLNYDIYSEAPAYDLGYLLRMLPVQAYVQKQQDRYIADWKILTCVTTTADTPEDAAAKLAIELFKQGIPSKESGEADG